MFAIDSKWNPFPPLIPYREHDGFGVIEQEAGTNRFIMSVGQWIERTKATGILGSHKIWISHLNFLLLFIVPLVVFIIVGVTHNTGPRLFFLRTK